MATSSTLCNSFVSCKGLAKDGYSGFHDAVLGNYPVRIAGHVEHFHFRALGRQRLSQSAPIHARHDHIRQSKSMGVSLWFAISIAWKPSLASRTVRPISRSILRVNLRRACSSSTSKDSSVCRESSLLTARFQGFFQRFLIPGGGKS